MPSSRVSWTSCAKNRVPEIVFSREKLDVKSDDELRAMREAGLVVADTLALVEERCRPGMTTGQLDVIALEAITDAGARPSFPDVPGYRHTLCVSVDEQIVHGIPGDRVLREGDVVSVDCGASVQGWHGDSAVTFVVGGSARTPDEAALIADTREAMWAGIGAFLVGGRVGDIGDAVEDCLDEAAQRRRRPHPYGVVDDYEGHGIGREMHMAPAVPNVRTRWRGPRIRAGATVAIEPMVTLGDAETHVLEDDWTVVSADGSVAAHWEHTVAATRTGLWVLTATDGGEADLARAGLPFGPL